jgi:hypothetical protein
LKSKVITEDISKIILNMVQVHSFGKIKVSIMVSFLMIRLKGMENFSMSMEMCTLESGQTIKLKAKAHILIAMALLTLVSGKLINKMVLAENVGQMELFMKAST